MKSNDSEQGMDAEPVIEDIYVLSPAQKGILFHALLAPGTGVYCEQISFNLEGHLNIRSFDRAWRTVLDRHSVLRTSFLWEGLDEPLQVVHEAVDLPLSVYDWSEKSRTERDQLLATYLFEDKRKGFALSKAPLIRLALFRVTENFHHCVITFHHVLLDAWSVALILNEVRAFYEADSSGRMLRLPRPQPYRDYIAWLTQQDIGTAELFWREYLEGFSSPMPLPIKHSTSPNQLTLEEQLLLLPRPLSAKLRKIGRQLQLTLNTIIKGAWAVLLGRYCGERDIVFGEVVAGRPTGLPDVESMVGLFINILPVRMRLDPGEKLIDALQRSQYRQAEAHQYNYVSLADIQRWSELPRGKGLFDCIISFQNHPEEAFEAIYGIQLGTTVPESNLRIRNIRPGPEALEYDLMLTVFASEQLRLKISHSNRLSSATAGQMLRRLEVILEQMVADPDRRIGEVELLVEAERRQVLVEWNNTQAPVPADQCAHELIESQAERTPHAHAVACNGRQLSYWELNRRSNHGCRAGSAGGGLPGAWSGGDGHPARNAEGRRNLPPA